MLMLWEMPRREKKLVNVKKTAHEIKSPKEERIWTGGGAEKSLPKKDGFPPENCSKFPPHNSLGPNMNEYV
jgi:hypothetical protein